MEANFEIYCLIQLSHPIISFYIPSEVHIVRKTFKAFQGPEYKAIISHRAHITQLSKPTSRSTAQSKS